MKQLITNAILPKLIIYLRDEFTINPLDQDIEPLLRVFKWKTYVPSHLFSNLLETEFFNKWSNVLWIWVTSPGAQLDEITAWYQSWKKLFYSHELDTLTCSKEGFKTGLDMMNQGVSSQKPKSFIKTTSKDIGLKTKIESVQFSFKDYIQQLCAESNIEFVPTLKKSSNGLPIFKMGRNSVYIDDDVLYMLKDGDYKYIDVDDAIAQSIK
jgi:tuftelin-interacting protein 11